MRSLFTLGFLAVASLANAAPSSTVTFNEPTNTFGRKPGVTIKITGDAAKALYNKLTVSTDHIGGATSPADRRTGENVECVVGYEGGKLYACTFWVDERGRSTPGALIVPQ